MRHLFALAAAFTLLAAEPAGFVHWKAASLKAYGPKLAAKMDAKKTALEQLGKWGNHLLLVAHREGSGEAELHETQADIFVVQEGEATLVTGGEVVGPKTTAPGEIRGPSIKGGGKTSLGPGDMVHIPAGVPHQLLLAPGARFTYAVAKIDTH
jgi:mannose-6-phosphate isomerase-like protein (cupin superfamily)